MGGWDVLGGHDELVVEDPFGGFVEEGGGRVDVHEVVIHHGFESFLGVFFGDVGEVTAADGLLDFLVVAAC